MRTLQTSEGMGGGNRVGREGEGRGGEEGAGVNEKKEGDFFRFCFVQSRVPKPIH